MYLIAFMYFFFKRNNSYTWERFMGAFKKVVYSPPIIKIKKNKNLYNNVFYICK
jgi:hypothetical protein